MEIEYDTVKFSSGREIYANGGIIGIVGANNGLFVFGGYDDDFPDENLTPEEKAELADYMIGLWNDYKKGEINVTT